MLGELTVLMGLLAMGEAGPSPAIRAGEFEGWFGSARRGELEIPDPVTRKAAGFRYVFVGGFRNERMPGYFAQNKAELRSLGVPRSLIHVINPRSDRTSSENAEEVRSRFQAIAAEGPEKLVVIAHSRGACDALAFAIGNASFVAVHVEALFLIQGPFGGSGVADFALGRGPAVDRRLPWRHRFLVHLAGRVVRARARVAGLGVLESMTREASRTFWAKVVAEHAEAVATVGPRTFFVRSEVEPSRLRFVRRAIACYLKVYVGPGDGVVALADQILPDFGTVVATLEAGHADLTQRWPASRAPRATRRALIRSILMAVGQPEPGASPSGLAVPERRPRRWRPHRRASAEATASTTVR